MVSGWPERFTFALIVIFNSRQQQTAYLGGRNLEAPSGQRGALGMLNRILDASFPIGIGHPRGIGDHGVMSQHRAVNRVEPGLVQIRLEDAFLQVVEHDIAGDPAKIPERLFVELRPDLLARLPDHPPEAAPRVAQRHHEEAGTTVPPALRINRRRTLAIVDLSLLAREELKAIKLLGVGVPQRAHKPLDALVAGRKAKLIDQVLVNRLCIPLQADLFFDPRPIWFAGRAGQAAGDCPSDTLKAGGRGGGIWSSAPAEPAVTPGEFASAPARSAR